jgi:hypothetical protein
VRLTFISSVQLAAACVQPAGDLWYDWSTSTWTTPFSEAAHLLVFTPLEASPSVVDTMVTAELGTVPLSAPEVSTVLFTTTPLQIVDQRALQIPIPPPTQYNLGQVF